jgi:hypothetical protein
MKLHVIFHPVPATSSKATDNNNQQTGPTHVPHCAAQAMHAFFLSARIMISGGVYPLIVSLFFMAFLYPAAALAAAPILSGSTLYWTISGKITSATASTAKMGATIDSDGGELITERGIVWNTAGAPTTADNKVIEGGTGTGIFSVNASGLPPAALIYFQGYAINAGGTSYSGVATYYTEPATQADPPTVVPLTGTNYFDLTVNYTIPSGADGVLVVVRQTKAPENAPYDGTIYTPNTRIGDGDTTVPGCYLYCEYVVADAITDGNVTVTGLKADTLHYFTVYAYKGSGTGSAGINYVRSITATVSATTDSDGGISHNQQYVPGYNTPAECAYCHGVHHTSQLLPTGLDQWDKCFSCHDGTPSTKINIGLHLSDGSVDCGTCHSLHSWRTEELYSTSHAGVKGFNQTFVRANMSKYINTTDYPPPTGGGTLTALDNTVFQDRTTDFAFSTPDPVTGKYNGVCQTCHLDTAVNHYTQTGADTHRSGLDCMICHVHKQTDQFNAFRPGHQVGGVYADFGSDAECEGCHDPDPAKGGVLDGIHGDGIIATCSLCHSGTPTRDNEKLGDSITISGKSPAGDARLANGVAAAGTWSSITCVTCHTGLYHGITIAAVAPKHQLSSNSSRGYDCERCHAADKVNEQLTTHMGTDTVANCVTICHGRTTPAAATTTIVARTVIDNVTFSDPEPNLNDTRCEHCHAQKGDYTLHGMTDDDSVDDGIDNANGPNSTTGLVTHNNLGGSLGAWSTSGNTMPSYRAATYTGKIDYDTYGGLLAADYNCGDCHSGSISTKSFTTLRAMQVHTKANGVGRGDCLTCHVEAISVADEINTGKGASVTTVNCETCHSIANGNGPSGEKLYQYDGLRHHKTAKAQAGDCSWCHADPRPAIPVQGTWDGYNAYADTADSDGSGGADDATDGWASDYTPPGAAYTTPEQPGCYLCHTNATSYSVEVYGLNGLHGFNFNAGTAAQRTTGLTVWANNYDARAGSYSNANNAPYDADPMTQALVHRIEANDGTSLIKAENLGACMACHSVQLHHAVPKPTADYDDYTGDRYRMPWDVLRYGPGRSIFGNGYLFRGTSNSATSWDDHMKDARWRGECRPSDCRDRTRNGYMREQPPEFSWGPGVAGDSQVVIPCNSNYNNFENLTNLCAGTGVSNGGQYQAIVFADFAAATVDSVYITLAEWNGTDVNVRVYNKLGAGQTMRMSYSGGACTNAPVNLTWNTDHYEGTCTGPGNFTNGIDYVTVSNLTTASTLDFRTRLVNEGSAP